MTALHRIAIEDVHPMNDVDPGWYVLRVHEDELTVFERVRDAKFDAFLPFIWALRGKDRKAVPLYPRYLFARQNANPGRLGRIDGVSYILGGEDPGIVPAEGIWKLRAAMDLHGGAINEEWWRRGRAGPIKSGDSVRVTTGEHADRIGFVHGERTRRRSSRVAVMLDTADGTRLVYLPEHYLAQLTAAPPAA